MKATLEFQLPDDAADFTCALSATAYHAALCQIAESFRQKVKYEERQETTWDEAKQLFWDALREAGVQSLETP
jgi:hypothetical protein